MAGFLVYMTPAAFIVTWELAKYFFGDTTLAKNERTYTGSICFTARFIKATSLTYL